MVQDRMLVQLLANREDAHGGWIPRDDKIIGAWWLSENLVLMSDHLSACLCLSLIIQLSLFWQKKGEEKRERKSFWYSGGKYSIREQCAIYTWAVDSHLIYPFRGHTMQVAWLGATRRSSRKQLLITFTSSLLYFYPWIPSAKMRGLLPLWVIFVFSVNRELCLDSCDWINFIQIRAFFKTGPIMWALCETVSPFYFNPTFCSFKSEKDK